MFLFKDAVNELAVKRKASPVTVNTLSKWDSVIFKVSQNKIIFGFHLLDLLAENGRLNRLNGVAQAFGKLMSAHKGEVLATVTTAKELDAKEAKELQGVLQQFVKKGSKLQVEMKVRIHLSQNSFETLNINFWILN